VQLVFKTLLYAEFADVLGSAVVGLLVVVLNFGFFGLVDAPDIANDVAGQFTIWVVAKQPGLDFDPRKTKPLRGKARNLYIGQTGTHRQGLKAFGLFHQLFKTAPIARSDV